MPEMRVYITKEGKAVAADASEAQAFGWKPAMAVQQTGAITGTTYVPEPQPVGTISQPIGGAIEEKKDVRFLGGVMQTAGQEPQYRSGGELTTVHAETGAPYTPARIIANQNRLAGSPLIIEERQAQPKNVSEWMMQQVVTGAESAEKQFYTPKQVYYETHSPMDYGGSMLTSTTSPVESPIPKMNLMDMTPKKLSDYMSSRSDIGGLAQFLLHETPKGMVAFPVGYLASISGTLTVAEKTLKGDYSAPFQALGATLAGAVISYKEYPWQTAVAIVTGYGVSKGVQYLTSHINLDSNVPAIKQSQVINIDKNVKVLEGGDFQGRDVAINIPKKYDTIYREASQSLSLTKSELFFNEGRPTEISSGVLTTTVGTDVFRTSILSGTEMIRTLKGGYVLSSGNAYSITSQLNPYYLADKPSYGSVMDVKIVESIANKNILAGSMIKPEYGSIYLPEARTVQPPDVFLRKTESTIVTKPDAVVSEGNRMDISLSQSKSYPIDASSRLVPQLVSAPDDASNAQGVFLSKDVISRGGRPELVISGGKIIGENLKDISVDVKDITYPDISSKSFKGFEVGAKASEASQISMQNAAADVKGVLSKVKDVKSPSINVPSPSNLKNIYSSTSSVKDFSTQLSIPTTFLLSGSAMKGNVAGGTKQLMTFNQPQQERPRQKSTVSIMTMRPTLNIQDVIGGQRQKDLQRQNVFVGNMNIQSQRQDQLQKQMQVSIPMTTTMSITSPMNITRASQPTPSPRTPRTRTPGMPRFGIPQAAFGGRVKFKEPTMRISFGKPRRQRFSIVPMAGLLSQGMEMSSNIARGRWQYPRNPKSTRKSRKAFASELFSPVGIGMEFPTARGTKASFSMGVPSGRNVMPSSKNPFSGKRRRFI